MHLSVLVLAAVKSLQKEKEIDKKLKAKEVKDPGKKVHPIF